mgnify:CR=1 FL=1
MAVSGLSVEFNNRPVFDGLNDMPPRKVILGVSTQEPQVALYENGAFSGEDLSAPGPVTNPQSPTLIVGALNLDGFPINFTNYTCGFASAGLSMTENQIAQYTSAVTRLMKKWKRMD